jgi:molybdate transport system ATP-binding protein
MRWDVAIDLHVGRRADARFHLDVAFTSDASRLVLFGASGAGKSLTLMAIAGLLRPDRGHVALEGDVLADAARFMPARDRRLAYLFQDYALFPHLDVRQNVAFGLARGWRNPSRAVKDERVDRWLHTLELDRLADRYPEQLSGGQRQRAALARALVGEPRALLLDEPFAALDGALRERLRDALATLCERLSLPLILITHDPADVERFGEQVITIAQGRVVGEAS